MADHLINIKVNLISNADAFAADIRRQLKEIDAAARTAAATGGRAPSTTPRAITARFARQEGAALAQLQASGQPRQQIRAAFGTVRQEIGRARLAQEHGLRQQAITAGLPQPTIRPPARGAVLAAAEKRLALENPELTANKRRLNQAYSNMADTFDRQLSSEKRVSAESNAAQGDLTNQRKAIGQATKRQAIDTTARAQGDTAAARGTAEQRGEQLRRLTQLSAAGRAAERAAPKEIGGLREADAETANRDRIRSAIRSSKQLADATKQQTANAIARVRGDITAPGGTAEARGEQLRQLTQRSAAGRAVPVSTAKQITGARQAEENAATKERIQKEADAANQERSNEAALTKSAENRAASMRQFFKGTGKANKELTRERVGQEKAQARQDQAQAKDELNARLGAAKKRTGQIKDFFKGSAQATKDMLREDPNFSGQDFQGAGRRLKGEREVRQLEREARDLQAHRDPTSALIGARAKDARRQYDADVANARRVAEQESRNRGPVGRFISGVRAEARVAAGTDDVNRAGPFQRLQQSAARRQGTFKPAAEFQTLKQFATQKLVNTAGFALSGAVLFGGISFGKDVLREATELEQELAKVQSMFEETGDVANGVSFDKFKESVRGIAISTGTDVSQATAITRQLAGTFSTPEKGPDFERAEQEAEVALRFAKLTGLPTQEINDSMTAIALAFDVSFTQIADAATSLDRNLGVSQKTIVQFVADLAPVGKELGFSMEQLSSLAAVAVKSSGLSGTALSQQLSRILPSIEKQRNGLIELFAKSPLTDAAIPDLAEAFNAGEIDQVLAIIIQQYGKLNEAQKDQLANMIGQKREIGTFYALLENPPEALKALSAGEGLGAGEFERQWRKFADTVQFTFEQMRRKLEDFAIALISSGIDDALKSLARLLGFAADAGSLLFRFMGFVNDVMGGIPGKILLAVTALQAFNAISTKIAATEAFKTLSIGASSIATLARGGLAARGAAALPNDNPLAGEGVAAASGSSLASGVGTGAAVGAGATLKAGLTRFGPLIAVALGAVAIDKIMAMREEVLRGADEIEKQTLEQLKAGADPNKIKADVLKGIGEEGFLENTGLNELLGIPSKRDAAQAAIDDARSANEEKAIKAMEQTALSGKNRVEFITAASNVIFEKDLEEGYSPTGGSPKLLNPNPDYSKVPFEKREKRVAEIFADYEKDKNKKNYDAVVSMLTAGGLSPDLIQEILASGAAVHAELQAVQDAVDQAAVNADTELDTQTQIARYESGAIDFDTLIAVLEKQKPGLLKVIAGATGEALNKGLQDLLAFDARTKQLIVDEIKRQANNRQHVGQILMGGDTTPKQELGYALDTFRDLSASGVATDQELIDAAFEVADARNAVWKDAIDNAKSAGEAKAIYNKGPETLPLDVIAALNLAGNEAVDAIRDVYRLRRLALIQRRFTFRKAGEEIAAGQSAGDIDALGLAAVGSAMTAGIGLYAGGQVPKNLGAGGDLLGGIEDRGRSEGSERLAAQHRIRRAKMRDDVDKARDRIQELRESRAYLDPKDPNAAIKLDADIAEAEESLADTLISRAEAVADSAFEIARAQARGDPLRLALIDVQAAKAALGRAKTDPERQAAQAQLITALFSVADAQDEIHSAAAEYLKAVVGQGTVEGAQIDKDLADQAVAKAAEGSAEKWRAMAAQVDAGRAMRDALFDTFAAQSELAAALYDASGDHVMAAKTQLDQANEKYRSALAAGNTPQNELDRLHAEAIRQQTAFKGTLLNDKLGDLEYLYEFDKITVDQYINHLQDALAAIPESDKETRREILRKIKALREELSADLNFNLPTNLKLPTLYEARRLNQSPGGYQDNRVVTITLTANNAIDGQAAVESIVNAINGPPRVGVSPRMY